MFFVYILRSSKNGRLYTGSTGNFARRLFQHQNGVSKATRHLRPFEVLRVETYLTRTDAVRRERFLKTGLGREELKRLLGH